jgi:predicted transposase/invertase (TIGR01784 family)
MNNLQKYIDPLTDFGFKRLFGSEPDKDIMIDFLNALFEGEKTIADIIYSPTEYNGETSKEKRVLFDLSCTGTDGEKFIIEMQPELSSRAIAMDLKNNAMFRSLTSFWMTS